jgi:hypothetical protein
METSYEGANNDFSVWTRKDNASSFMVPTEETFLDPQFWQALGRALGWSEACALAMSCRHGAEEGQSFRGSYWMYQWHCFIQALADGNPPAAFFAHLPSSQTMSRGTKHRHEAGKEPPQRARFLLIIEETCQHSQHICEAAASAQERAREMRQMSVRARHRRQSDHVERTLWREHCGVKCSTPERVLTRSFTAV